MWTSWKRVCRHHLGTVVVVSLLPRICCVSQCGYVLTAVYVDSAWRAVKISYGLLGRYEEGVLSLWRLSIVILSAAKLVVTGLVAGAGSVILVQTSSDCDQNYQTTPILLISLVIFGISSSD